MALQDIMYPNGEIAEQPAPVILTIQDITYPRQVSELTLVTSTGKSEQVTVHTD
jgi:hypothetical protein